MRWTDPHAVRVLVLVEPELFRSALARVIGGAPGVEAAVDDPRRYAGPWTAELLHPASGPDVVLASPELAPRLARSGLPVIEVPEASQPAIVLHNGEAPSERRAATLRSLIRLIDEMVPRDDAAAEAR